MAETNKTSEEGAETAPKKKSKLPLFLGLVLALVGGGSGFYAVQSGMFLGGESQGETTPTRDNSHVGGAVKALPDIAFVAIDPLVISLGLGAASQHLRFRAQLEVPSKYKSDVETLLPRVVDVLNSYLRALEVEDLADAAALVRLRAQMLRRVQIVTGPSRINDLLIMEFVLN